MIKTKQTKRDSQGLFACILIFEILAYCFHNLPICYFECSNLSSYRFFFLTKLSIFLSHLTKYGIQINKLLTFLKSKSKSDSRLQNMTERTHGSKLASYTVL